MPRAVSALAWAAIVGQVVFVACWIIAGTLQRDYSHVEQAISDLGAEFAQHAWVMNSGIVVVGLSVAALAPGLLRTAPAPRRGQGLRRAVRARWRRDRRARVPAAGVQPVR